ncbi:cytochrome P450 [Kitasatospora sp. NBC_01250]|uniref:cytochrome P450 n=1 Tax=Kitasatospora sp. NBC_01250 TaxID=2903571 RepID=UPI002E2F7CAB|nr:cytochrome P450 [Kitasatospora sp. NBC_01250]
MSQQQPPGGAFATSACPHAQLVTGEPERWDAHRDYRALREQARVQQVVVPGGLVAWLVTGHAEAQQALTEPRLAHDMRRLPTADQGFGGRRYPDDIFAVEGRHLLNSDGPDHARLRAVLGPLLSRSATLRWRPLVDRVCAELLDELAEADTADLVADYARPLPARVTAQILGVGAGHVPRLTELTISMVTARDPDLPAVHRDREELFRLWARIIGAKRREPGDDLLTRLLRSCDRGDLSPQELASVAWGVFSGGIASTTTAITAGAIELMRTTDPLGALAHEPDASRLVEEILRLTSPFAFAAWRFATESVTIGATTIPQGSVVLVGLAAANRDPRVFPVPDALAGRGHGRRAHLAFGRGAHYCPGAQLARMEVATALTSLFERLPTLRLAVPESALRWRGVLLERCYEAVPVRTGAIRVACSAR